MRILILVDISAEDFLNKRCLDMAKDNIFDKFYTNDDIADCCFARAVDMTGYDGSSPLVEPSAGGGAFIRAFRKHGFDKFDAYDIAPESDGILK